MPGKALNEVPRFDRKAFSRARKNLRLSQDDVGLPVNISRHIIAAWEKGKTPPTARGLRAAAYILEVEPWELLTPLDDEPTIADLRENCALTLDELAYLTSAKPARLALWERTGLLGTADEHPLLLAALVGFSYDSVAEYVRSGRIPQDLLRSLARSLRVTTDAVQRAFDHTASLSASTEQRDAA